MLKSVVLSVILMIEQELLRTGLQYYSHSEEVCVSVCVCLSMCECVCVCVYLSVCV